MVVSRTALFVTVAAAALLTPSAAFAGSPDSDRDDHNDTEITTRVLASGLQGTSGSTIGPDGAVYVTESTLGQITRVDADSGETSVFATGLPPAIIALGGAIDVAFVDDTAYALVTVVGENVGGVDASGIYRLDESDDSENSTWTVVADLGAFSAANLPDYPVDLTEGLQFAFEPTRDGFLITDGHHNRLLHADWDGAVTELVAFGNTVPIGITTSRRTIYLAEAGAIPHAPEDGRVIGLDRNDLEQTTVASGYSLLVDVEFDDNGTLYALSQGDSPGEVPAGSPALPTSGELLRVTDDGTLTPVVEDLNLPTSVDFTEDAAFVVAQGDVIRVDNLSDGHNDHDDDDNDHDHDGGHHGGHGNNHNDHNHGGRNR
jgi:sugar lactone lactonase YvrE